MTNGRFRDLFPMDEAGNMFGFLPPIKSSLEIRIKTQQEPYYAIHIIILRNVSSELEINVATGIKKDKNMNRNISMLGI